MALMKRPLKKYLWLFLLVIFLPQPALAHDGVVSAVTLQLKWKHKFQFAGYYAALHKGFFLEEGLDVTLKEGGLGINPLKKVLEAEQAVYGIDSGELLYHRLQGKPVIAIASIYQHSASMLMTLASSGLLTPHDLAGKRVAMQVHQQNIIEIAAMFVSEGVALESLSLSENLPFPQDLYHLQNQRLDASFGYLTSEPYLMRKAGVAANYIRPLSYGIDFYGDTLFTTERELNDHPSG